MGAQVMNFINLVLPALWTVSGPAFVVMLTATSNNLAKLYIPRAIQIPLAGIIGAIAAGLSGVDPVTGAAAGAGVQSALSMPPDKFLAGPPVKS